MMLTPDPFCPAVWCEHRCTRLHDHSGDHYDAVTEHRWHNQLDDYGQHRSGIR
jgi:hypothetical protein